MKPIKPVTMLSSICANAITRALSWTSPSAARSFCFWHRLQALQHPSWVGRITWEKVAGIPLGLKMQVPVTENQGMRLSLGYPYEVELTSRLIEYLRSGDVFVDVGANMGYFSLLASRLVAPAGRVLSFEPCLGNLARLTHNLMLNHLTNVLPFPSALSDRDGMASISIPPFYNNGISTLRETENGHPSQPVALQRFDDIPDSIAMRQRIRLIKIDTEGHEWNVLQGMQNTLNLAQPMAVACELTPAWVPVESIVELLSRAGFRGEYFCRGAWHSITSGVTLPVQCNAWFVKDG